MAPENKFKIPWHLIVPYSLFAFVYTDYWCYASYGAYISLALASVLIFLTLSNFRIGLLSSLIVLFTTPSYPRDILNIYSSLRDTNEMQYFSLKYMSVGGFTLVQWVFVILFVISVMKLIRQNVSVKMGVTIGYLKMLVTLMLILTCGTFLSFLFQRHLYFREIASDYRFPVLSMFGIFIAVEYKERMKNIENAVRSLVYTMLYIVIITGLKNICFLIDDRISNVTKLSFSSPIYLNFPVLLAFLAVRNSIGISQINALIIVLLGVLSIFPEGRGDYITYFLALLASYYLVSKFGKTEKYSYLRNILAFLVIFIFMTVFVIFTNEEFAGFIINKLSFFFVELINGNYSESPVVRIYELKNILAEAGDSIYGVVIGQGAGGYFEFKSYELPFQLQIADYTKFELANNKYFHPHLFFNYWLLKGGAISLWIYIYIYFAMFKVSAKGLSRGLYTNARGKMFCYFAAISAPIALIQAYWQPDYILFYSFILTLIFLSVDSIQTGQNR